MIFKHILLLLFLFSIKGNSNEWIDYKSFSIEKNSNYLIVIENDIDADIQFQIDNNPFFQNLPGINRVTEYFVIKSSKYNREFIFKFRTKFKIWSNLNLKFSIKKYQNIEELKYYHQISILSQYWFDKSILSKQKTDKLIRDLFSIKVDDKKKLERIKIRFEMFIEQGHFNELIQMYENIGRSINSNTDLMNYLHLLYSNSLMNKIKFNEALRSYVKLLSKFKKKKNRSNLWISEEIFILSRIGLIKSILTLKHTSNADNGLTELNEALKSAMILGNDLLTSKVLINLSSYYDSSSQGLKSIAVLDLASEYWNKSFNFESSAIFSSKGVSLLGLNQIGKAQTELREALHAFDLKNHNINDIQYNLALAYFIIGDLKRAKRYIENIKEDENSFYHYLNMKLLGSINRGLSNFDIATSLHHSSINNLMAGSFNLALDSIVELALDYYASGNIEKSEYYAITSLVISEINRLKIGNDILKKSYIESFLKVGNINDLELVYSKINEKSFIEIKDLWDTLKLEPVLNDTVDYKAMTLLLRLSLNKNGRINSKEIIKFLDNDKLFDQLKINYKLNDLENKIDYYLSIKNFRKVDSKAKLSLSLINEQRVKYDVSDFNLHWTNQAKSILLKYIKTLIKQKKYHEIFIVLDKYYAINLREKRSNANSRIIKQKSKELQQALDDYVNLERENILYEDSYLQEQVDVAKERFLGIGNGDEDWKNNKTTELEYLTIRQVQDKLEADELLLRYYVNDVNTIVFVITNLGFDVMQLPKSKKLNTIVQSLINSVKSKRINNSFSQNALLSLLPMGKINTKKYNKVIIIPDGIINSLPFSSINISDNVGEYIPLASLIDIERTYSVSDYFADIKLENRSKSITIFANPIFLKNSKSHKVQSQYEKSNKLWEFDSLPYTEQEAQNIQQIFPKTKFLVFNGAKATNENFLSETSRNSNIIHIATHGFFNDSSLENVGIATSIIDEDGNQAPGILAMREILYQPFKANLAVVSGCETTLGKEISGEGFNSLSRGLLSQGVNSVIGTIWSISDRATPIFMKEFYTNLRDMNGNVSKALNTTKSNFATQPQFRRYRHPYYWAGFVLTSSNKAISENIFQ